jgi:Zn-dependent M16 (insulinase) family peptidase
MHLQIRRYLYPEGDGFRMQTGGLMENVRVFDAGTIRQFHRDMYQPKNIRLVLTGEVDHPSLLKVLDKVEDQFVHLVPGYDVPFKRPWVESKQAPPLSKTVVDTVEFPEEDESKGAVKIAFFGPKAIDELGQTAINTLIHYLTGSEASVLVHTLVEKEHLADEIEFAAITSSNVAIVCTVSSVDTDMLAATEKLFFDVLKEHASKPLDMSYLRHCLHCLKNRIRESLENSMHDCNMAILLDHVYGNRDGADLENAVATDVFKILDEWNEEDWRACLNRYMVDASHVSILGKPSRALLDKIKADEVARVKAQQEKLGKQGLEDLAQKLKEAQEENDRSISMERIIDLPIPDFESIHFHQFTTARSGLAKKLGTSKSKIQEIVDQDENGLPLFIQFEHIPTSFVRVGLALRTTSLPPELTPFLEVYIANFFVTPIMEDEKRIEFEKVVTRFEQDILEHSIDNGTGIRVSGTIYIEILAEAHKFGLVVSWLRKWFFDSVFDIERLISIVQRMLASVPKEKRDGDGVSSAFDQLIHHTAASAVHATAKLTKSPDLERIRRLLQEEPQEIVAKLEALRKHLLTVPNLRILVIANIETLRNPVSAFKHLNDAFSPSSIPIIKSTDNRDALLSDISRKPGGTHYIIPIAIESAFAVFTTTGVKGNRNTQLAPFMVALAHLGALGGPMWRSIRDTGLAYDSKFFYDLGTGLLQFRILKSPNIFAAYKKAMTVIQEYHNGTQTFKKLDLEGARSSIVRDFIDKQATMVDAARSSFRDVLLGFDKHWQNWMSHELRKVTEQDVVNILKDKVADLFISAKTDLVVTCGGNMTEVSSLCSVLTVWFRNLAYLFVQSLKKDFEDAGFLIAIK